MNPIGHKNFLERNRLNENGLEISAGTMSANEYNLHWSVISHQ